MRRQTLNQLQMDQLGLKFRWGLLLGGGAMCFDRFGEAWFVLGFVLLAVSNVAGWRLCSRLGSYRTVGRSFMAAMRFIDVLALTCLGFAPRFAGENLWLLAVPTVLFHGLVARSILSVSLLTLVGLVIPLSHMLRGEREGVLAAAVLSLSAVVGVILSAYREREQTLQGREERLATVLDCANALASSSDLKTMSMHALRACVKELGASSGYVMLTSEEDRESLVTEAAYSPSGEFEFPERLDIGNGVTGYAVKMGQPIAIHNGDDEQLDLEGVGLGARSVISVPLVARAYSGPAESTAERVLGAITLLGDSNSSFSSTEDMNLLRSIASLVAEAVSNARMEELQRTTFLKTLETLAKSLEARDVYTRGHSQRVSEVSLMIGERMGLSSEALEELRVGTILHDIGKIGVPDSILNKPGRLTDEEFAIMKSHPVIGYEICQPLGLSEGVLMIVRNHHEKLDGSGYPDGLKGGELPLSLRIVCVADAFDAMSSHRPYRDVMDMKKVMAEMSAWAGVQFDPVVVEVLKELLSTPQMQQCYEGQWGAREKAA